MIAEELTQVADAFEPAILVIDDNAVKRLAIRAMLGPLGYSVVEADSGRAAMRCVDTQTFATILVDVRMPIMDGYETVKLIRDHSRGSLTPVIFVTAFRPDEIETDLAYGSGAIEFVFTPVLPDVLRAKVSAFVDLFVQSQEKQRSLDSIPGLDAALRDSGVRTQTVLDNVSDGIVVLDEDGLIESVNRSLAQLFGYAAEEPVGQLLEFMIAPAHRHEYRDLEAAHSKLSAAGVTAKWSAETLGLRSDGSTFAMQLECAEMKHADRSFTLACVRDISERRAHTDALERQALYDDLTGLANRTLFSDLVTRALASAKRSDERCAVLVMNLDGFKQVNDAIGHDRGDALLRQVGERLTGALREADTVARLDGDGFAIMPADARDLAAAAEVAWKLQRAFESEFVVGEAAVNVSASIGIALFPEHGRTTTELLRCAEMAMYVVKRTGNGHAVFDAAQERKTADHLALLLDLRECVERDQLILHYQPKIDLSTREIFGVEALIRWRHPTQGLLQPGRFMPDVERTDLIEPLTRWVLKTALSQQRRWRDAGYDLSMAVNVSARSLQPGSTLPDLVAELTRTSAIPPGRLTLELTEGALIEAAALDVLARLHEMGQRVSIDDFGTGYSSLVYLQRLAADEIKVDRSFVTTIATTGADAIIVRSTIDLAHNLGLTVVAEGVEDQNVLDALVGYGCDAAQGFHFGRPAPAEELTEWLSESPYGLPAAA
jgi:diguanylate cyclase (GGDEF)-like protein/PAS domain S-box-containing protein